MDFTKSSLNFKLADQPRSKSMIFAVILRAYAAFSATFPLFLAVLLIGKPCLPPFLGWWILDCSSESSPINIYMRIGLPLITCVLITPAVKLAVTENVFNTFLEIVSFNMYLKGLRRKDNVDTVHQKIVKYRQIQLLALEFNNCYQIVVNSIVMPVVQLFTIIHLYGAIKLENIPVAGLFIIIMISFDGFVFIGIFYTCAGKVYEESVGLKKIWKRNIIVPGQSRYLNKLLKTCAPIKVKFGSTNFVESETAPTVAHFCFQQTASLLLLE